MLLNSSQYMMFVMQVWKLCLMPYFKLLFELKQQQNIPLPPPKGVHDRDLGEVVEDHKSLDLEVILEMI